MMMMTALQEIFCLYQGIIIHSGVFILDRIQKRNFRGCDENGAFVQLQKRDLRGISDPLMMMALQEISCVYLYRFISNKIMNIK